MRYVPLTTKPRRLLAGLMAVTCWLFCPGIEVIYGRVYHRHLYEFGEPPFPMIDA
jgi:hypothetical protein